MKSLKVLPSAISSASSLVKEALAKSSFAKNVIQAVSGKSQVSISVSLKVSQPNGTNQGGNVSNMPKMQQKAQEFKQEEGKSSNERFAIAMAEMLDGHNEPTNVNQSFTKAKAPTAENQKDPSAIPPTTVFSDDALDQDFSSVPRLSRSALYTRSKQLLRALATSTSSTNSLRQTVCLQRFNKHLIHYEEAVGACVSEGAIPLILRLRSIAKDRVLKAQINQSLALLGYADPPKGSGIRILSIDGGGIRGVIILEVLRELENLTGTPIHKMFDLICGVSTGAILSMLMGGLKKRY